MSNRAGFEKVRSRLLPKNARQEQIGRWLRNGSTIIVLPRTNPFAADEKASYELSGGSFPRLRGLKLTPSAAALPLRGPEASSALNTPRVLTYTTKDVIDNRISIPAQHSLVRLSKNPATSVDAVGMLEEVKAGRLAGIFCVNWQNAAQRAIRLGKSWWTVIPKGEDAVLLLDPDDLMGGPPMVAFRRELDPDCGLIGREEKSAPSPARLDAALRKAWLSFRLLRSGKLAHCDRRPEPTSTEAEAFTVPAATNVIPPLCLQPRLPHSQVPSKPSPRPKQGPAKPSGTRKPITGDELVSWCHPYATSPLIGQVYFPTNSTNLGADDKAALGKLIQAFNEFGDRFEFDPIGILFLGHADFRPTTFPGGNRALSEDRASVCADFFVTNLSAAALKSVVVHDRGLDADARLMRALQATGASRDKILKRMRMTAIMRPAQPPLIRPRAPIPPKSREEALERCRRVLRGFAGQFSTEELKHLNQICKDTTVRDGFLNGMDPDLQKITFGLGGEMTDAEAEAFANRFRVRTELMQPFATGPNADDLDVVGALKGLHSRIDMGIDELVVGAAHEGVTGIVNHRRAKLMGFVLKEKQNVQSIYFRWN